MAALSCGLRFWQLTRFDDLVFDEVYFVQFAQDYLSGTAPFDAHPPLGKYLIAAGIWLYERLPLPDSAASYRWLNALVGSAMPLVVMGFANTLGRQLSDESRSDKSRSDKSRSSENSRRIQTFAILAGLFVATDGLFVVESRYGLLNIYMVFLGLLGQWFWLLQSECRQKGLMPLRVLSGLCLGGAIAVKWNGLGFFLSLIVWELVHPNAWELPDLKKRLFPRRIFFRRIFSKNSKLPGLFFVFAIASATYLFAWLPHLQLVQENIWILHTSLISFHQKLPPDGHSACSQWFTWPLLIKPIAYWYEENQGLAYTVNNIGNPLVWWLSSSAILLMAIHQVGILVRRKQYNNKPYNNNPHNNNRLLSFLLISYGANWLPWILVNRCTFIYLYMPAAAFSFMALAWVISGWMQSKASEVRMMSWAIGIAIALAFCFWLPLSIGSPLTPESLQIRWWLKSWI